MRFGILSDIHSNYEALKASYRTLSKNNCDQIVCLGDVVGYGAQPIECIEFIIDHNIPCVCGNHDHYTTIDSDFWNIQPYAKTALIWTQDTLSINHLQWLSRLPTQIVIEDVTFVHASLDDNELYKFPYILDIKSALMHFTHQDTPFACYGHTHFPLFFSIDDRFQIQNEILSTKKIERSSFKKFLFNPGSVGQPRDFDIKSSAMILDTVNNHAEILRSEYDIEKVQKLILDAKLPQILAQRLSHGR